MRIYKFAFLFFLLIFVSCASAPEREAGVIEEEKTGGKANSEAERYYSFGFEHMRQGNYEKAIPLLKKAIEADSSYVDAYLALRGVYLEIGDTNKALSICKKGLKCFTDQESNRQIAKAIADLYAKIGESEKAEQLFKKVIEENPRDGNSYDLYASYLEREGRLGEAIENYEKAYQYNPENRGIAFRLGNAYFEAKRYRDAIELFEKAKEAFDKDIEIREKLAESYAKVGEYRNAIEEYELIIEQVPKHVLSRLKIGNLYSEMGGYQKAEEYYKEALEIESSNLTIYYQLINLELTRKNLAGVRKYINEGFSIDRNDTILLALNGEYYYRLGLNYMRDKEWNPAIERFERAIDIWERTRARASDTKWVRYAGEGIQRAQKNIEQIKEVRW